MGRRLSNKAFDSIKCYLINAPTLSPPVLGRSLLLYISTTENALGAILVQHGDDVAEKGKGELEMISALQLKKGVKEGQLTYLATLRVAQEKLLEEPLLWEFMELLG
ncbi:hypothetical protein Ancab_003407 [Ancistrocladus abbreviatus]